MTERSTPWTRAIARALKDQAFKSRLMADPVATLKGAGVAVPDGLGVLDGALRIGLSDAELERVAAGRYQPCSGRDSGCGGIAP